MTDSAGLLRARSGLGAPDMTSSRTHDSLHPGADVGIGVVRSAGEYRLVATRLFPARQRLFRIEGDLTHKPSRYSVQIGYQLHVDLDGPHTSEEILDRYFWRFMNHSCEPNAHILDRDVFATRDIRAWEPVTFDYTTTEWEMAEPFSCSCGSAHCLGQVQGYRFLSAAQRARLGSVAAHLGRHLNEASPPVTG
jgi:hypothetical protein